ncbi:MAG: hypothetical protein ACRDMZ_00750 [Solirubrobacteraceae bacterium]
MVEEMVAKLQEEAGQEVEVERPVAECGGWHFGERVRVIDDDEESGMFAGDEGWLVLETVGAAEHGNERVCFGVLADGFADPVEVQPDNIESVL